MIAIKLLRTNGNGTSVQQSFGKNILITFSLKYTSFKCKTKQAPNIIILHVNSRFELRNTRHKW